MLRHKFVAKNSIVLYAISILEAMEQRKMILNLYSNKVTKPDEDTTYQPTYLIVIFANKRPTGSGLN